MKSFIGSIPTEAVEQITRVVPFDDWRKVFVGCSGSYRIERAIRMRHPHAQLFSNDVSLLSCGIGAMALGLEFPVAFKERLGFVEDALNGAPFDVRVGAVLVACDLANYAGNNDFAKRHFDHCRTNFDEVLHAALNKLAGIVGEIKIEGFYPGDFRLQAARATKEGGGVIAFPPFRKGDERLSNFVNGNIDWPAPEFQAWDPVETEHWIGELDAAGLPHCVLTDQRFDSMDPVSVFYSVTRKPIYAYAGAHRSSIRRVVYKATPFRYTPAAPRMLTKRSTVQIVPVETEHMEFIKTIYLGRAIDSAHGSLNFLVYLDGCLAGGFIFHNRPWLNDKASLYLISDFAVSSERRLSKLIAMLATSRHVVRLAENKFLRRVSDIYTTAFTERPVSMKYRGAFELAGRKPGLLNYRSKVRDGSPQDIFKDWVTRFAGKGHAGAGAAEAANAHHPGQAA